MKILLSLMVMSVMQAAAPSPVQVISREMMSMVDEPRQAVAHSATEWASLWRQHAGEQPLPAVDFTSRMVVAIFLGTRGSAGYAADVTGVRTVDGGLVVEWQERRPKRGEVSAQVLTSPAVLVSVPKFDGKVTFRKVEP